MSGFLRIGSRHRDGGATAHVARGRGARSGHGHGVVNESPAASFTVATMNVEPRERDLLREIVSAESQGGVAFATFVKDGGALPDIVIVNGDDARTMQSWLDHAPALGERSVALILSDDPSRLAGHRFVLRRPFETADLQRILLDVAAELGAPRAPLPGAGAETGKSAQTDPAQVAPPVEPAAADVLAVAASAAAVGRPKGVRALVVDDSLPARVQMQHALRSIAEHVDFAADGEQAMRLLERSHYDIAFLDVDLPDGETGYRICERMKSSEQHHDTPVIMLVSNSAPADRARGRQAGIDTYLIKPVKQGVFEEVVRVFLRFDAVC